MVLAAVSAMKFCEDSCEARTSCPFMVEIEQ
jgi:hypothetical protein